MRSTVAVPLTTDDECIVLDAIARLGGHDWLDVASIEEAVPLRLRWPLLALLRLLEEAGYVECSPSLSYIAGLDHVRFKP